MRRILLFITVLGLLAAACGSDDSDATTTTAAPTTTQASTTTQAPSTTTTTTVAPTTTEATTTTTEPEAEIPTTPVVPGEDADADAIVDLFAVVFDSATTFEEKAPLIDDPTGLETAVAGYQAAGEGVGGIFLEVTETGVLDDQAAVVYDLLFGGNAFQSGQPGEAVRIDDTWVVTRDFFCSIVELARVPCS